MKFRKSIIAALCGAVAFASCSDKMDYREVSVYDEDYVKTTFSRTGGLISQIYTYLESDFGTPLPFSSYGAPKTFSEVSGELRSLYQSSYVIVKLPSDQSSHFSK